MTSTTPPQNSANLADARDTSTAPPELTSHTLQRLAEFKVGSLLGESGFHDVLANCVHAVVTDALASEDLLDFYKSSITAAATILQHGDSERAVGEPIRLPSTTASVMEQDAVKKNLASIVRSVATSISTKVQASLLTGFAPDLFTAIPPARSVDSTADNA